MIDIFKIASSLLEFGALGIVVAILIVGLIRKDKQINMLYDKLIKRSENDVEKYHKLADSLNSALRELFVLFGRERGNKNDNK